MASSDTNLEIGVNSKGVAPADTNEIGVNRHSQMAMYNASLAYLDPLPASKNGSLSKLVKGLGKPDYTSTIHAVSTCIVMCLHMYILYVSTCSTW